MHPYQDKLLHVNHLSIHFRTEEGEVRAVEDLNFELRKGEVLGIVGESGSGKSVSSLAIMGLLSANASIPQGEIQFYGRKAEGENLLQLSEDQYQSMRGKEFSMIFQEPMTSLNPVMCCGDQVVEAIQLHQKLSYSEAKEQCLQWFEEVQLPRPEKIFKSYPHEISGGQKQRVMIAMAISSKPKLLIADEPTTALDVRVQKTILDLLLQLQKKLGMSMIFITHDLGVIAQVAQRVLVMYRGQLVEQGEVKQIFKNPHQAYTQGLIHCRPSTEQRPKQLATIDHFLQQEQQKKAFVPEYITNEMRQQQHQKMYAQPPLITVRNLSTSFITARNWLGKPTQELKAVSDVSFEVYPGETLGLVGESGCGKTTLGRSLLQMIESKSGSVIYNNIDLKALSDKALRNLRKEIQIIFQDPYSSLNPRLSVGEAILEPMLVHHIYDSKKEARAKVIELLERVNLGEQHYHRYPHEFSGGQRQRIVIARSLALKPKFVVCDESVSALDVSVQAQVLNLLNELKQDFGLTYVFISHDLSVVKYMSDRIMVMQNGNLVELNEADQLYHHPQMEYTQQLIEAIPRVL